MPPDTRVPPFQRWGAVAASLTAALAFHLAFSHPALSFLALLYFERLLALTRVEKARLAFYAGTGVGLLVFVPKVTFFYTLFGVSAAALWLILAVWHGLFVYLAHWARRRFSPPASVAWIACCWTGLEYFRSELYSLKFSWLAGGFALMQQPSALTPILGVYGVSFVAVLLVAAAVLLPSRRFRLASVAGLVVFTMTLQLPLHPTNAGGRSVEVAGMQLEFPVELEVPAHLDALKQRHPGAKIFVLSEYTFDGPLPPLMKKWCKHNAAYLIVGAKEMLAGGQFYNTAYVVSPEGEVVFQQVKATPIQFFQDGLPAPEQRPWDSPWGKIGICICYDLCYSRVTDRLIRQGAEALIVPTMDVAEWGRAQHELHARIAPMRAAEYRVPIFRLASSGISQAVNHSGVVESSAPFPGPGEMLSAQLTMGRPGSIPVDRFLAPACSAFALLGLGLSFVRPKKSLGQL